MAHEVKIAGEVVRIAWDQATQRQFLFRMGEIGGEPSIAQLSNKKTVTTAIFKVLWGLIPKQLLAKYPDPESLFVAVDHENEAEAIFTAIMAVYSDSSPDTEKKSTLKKSPSPELS